MSERTLLMIPGPIELEPEVLRALSRPQLGHMDPEVTRAFGRILTRLQEVFLAPPGSQPLVVAGSGTLAMELAVANVVDPGDRAVVVNTGYFSDRMGAILERLGATVTQVPAPHVGDVPDLADVERAVAGAKLVTVTHVDTSTGVRAPVADIARIARQHGALVVVDGVCAVGGEELRQEAWDVDVVLTGSQKALGAPPGLALVMFGPRAMAAFRARRTTVASLYLDLAEWLPIMEGYEIGQPVYFATPPVNLLLALDVSLGHLVAEGMEARFARHARQAAAMRAAWKALGLRLVPAREELAASTLSAVYYPEGVDASFVGRMRAQGIAIAGGLHPAIKARYFRVGHMGAMKASDLVAAVAAVERAFLAGGHRVEPGAGVAALQAVLSQ